jgi:transcription antitermination factor NusA-like protein
LSALAIVGEVDPRELELDPTRKPLYDYEAYKRILDGQPDRCAELRLLDLPDEVVRARAPEYLKLFDELKALEVQRVASNYAYVVKLDPDKNALLILYASSENRFDEFENIKQRYSQLIESLNHMLWDTLKYIEYTVIDAKVEEIRRKILGFYRKIPSKYIDVAFWADDQVTIYVPKQLKGLVIGKQGANVNMLQQLLGLRIKVVDLPWLTEAYAEEHPEIPKDEETLKLISEAARIIRELERRGVTLKQLEKLLETLPETEGEKAE